MDVIRDSIESRADDVCRAKEELRTTPVYPYSAAYAREHGELEQYRTSNNVNLQCKESIEAAVREEQQLSRTQGEKIQPSRPSVRDKLKQELPAHKPAAPKKREPER